MTTMDRAILRLQRMESLQAEVYSRLASNQRYESNHECLTTLAADEQRHYEFWAEITGTSSQASRPLVLWYLIMAKVLGLSFCLNLLERKEQHILEMYEDILDVYPGVAQIQEDEQRHEQLLLASIEEEYLNYTGSFVLGLNDALIELTGVLAGLTLAFQNQKTIAIAGLVTGVAASLSMASSEYLSKGMDNDQNRLKAAGYTGVAYLITDILLISPYIIITPSMASATPFDLPPYMLSLIFTLVIALLIIISFNYYTSVALRRPFRRNFIEMLLLILGVTTITFALGFGIRVWYGAGI